MPSLDVEQGAPTYWRSMNDLAETDEFRKFVENEFPSRADELVDPLSRRRFLKVMGASLALAGLTGCDDLYPGFRWPEEKILPFAARPEGRHPGTAVYYATNFEESGVAQGVLAKSVDGRPIKIEGNDVHPGSWGAATSQAQASVLSVYDPDRSKSPAQLVDGALVDATWEDFLADKRLLALKGGEGLFVLSATTSSKTLSYTREVHLDKHFPNRKWLDFDPLSRDNELLGVRAAFGKPLRPQYYFEKAEVVVCLGDDPLHDHPNALAHAREFANARRANGSSQEQVMNRLYVAEGELSLAGSLADHRLAVANSKLPSLALQLAKRIAAGIEDAPAALKTKLETIDVDENPFLDAAAADLLASAQHAVITAGPRQPAAVHTLVHVLNTLLQSEVVEYTAAPHSKTSQESMSELTGALKANKVKALLILGGNPGQTAKHYGLDLNSATSAGVFTVHLSELRNETSHSCSWHLPKAHYLESWDAVDSWDGTTGLVQPLIQPLFGGRTQAELIELVSLGMQIQDGKNPALTKPLKGYALTRNALKITGANEKQWQQFLHDGVNGAAGSPAVEVVLQGSANSEPLDTLAKLSEAAAPTLEALEVSLVPCSKLRDGRYRNLGWLQELPEPMTKLTWDNALLVSYQTAKELKIDDVHANLVKLSVGERTLEVAVMILPGLPDYCGVLSLGYPGQDAKEEEVGSVALGTGFDASVLRTSANEWLLTKVTAKATGRDYPLSTTQDHHAIASQIGRAETERRVTGLYPNAEGEAALKKAEAEAAGEKVEDDNVVPGGPWLFRETDLASYKANPDFAAKFIGPSPAVTQLWESPVDYADPKKYRWALSIDLNACTGCGACVVACQAENNIPVVGKSEVARGREMHWLRIDRYFRGDPRQNLNSGLSASDLRVVHQPVPCMQCENAPCESVCPVAATTHSQEGLNDMTYNRCIGTRYCSNNCPYKVRRFNYFYNHYGPFHPRSKPLEGWPTLPKPPELTPQLGDLERMVMNPDVTVRTRGVMEKCSYCVQRIKEKSIPAKNEKRRVVDGAIKTACQQTCPTQAMVFGDLNDPESEVARRHAHPRTYEMLKELNARPRTRYMAKLRNPRGEA